MGILLRQPQASPGFTPDLQALLAAARDGLAFPLRQPRIEGIRGRSGPPAPAAGG
jgi:hypothetical protein